jgi:signal transduction histidine kinase
MMSLRLRLTLLVASVFIGLWLLSSLWLIAGLRSELDFALDQRLQSTATMLNNILASVPENELGVSVPSILQANEMGNAKGLTCRISSLHGTVIASSYGNGLPLHSEIKEGFASLSADNVQWRTYALRTSKFVITIADNISERESLYSALLKSTLIPTAIALLVSLALLWMAIGRGLQPIRSLVKALETRGSNDLSPVSLDTPSSELAPLVVSQNALMTRLAEGMKREQEFTNNAAHELRTPLAGVLAQIQLAELSQGLAQEKALTQAKTSAQRLKSILDNLLALARVESDTELPVVAPWLLSRMLNNMERELGRGLTDVLEGKPGEEVSRINIKLMEDKPIRFIAKPLMAIVCRNLLENALKYSAPTSLVTLVAESSNQGVKITVRNLGKVKSTDIPNMAARFWRKGEMTGAGLGLSIVKAIANRYKGSLVLENQGEDFLVTITLPLST